jgi:hypothetical protein
MIRLQPDESYTSLLSTHHITQAYIQPFIGYTPIIALLLAWMII